MGGKPRKFRTKDHLIGYKITGKKKKLIEKKLKKEGRKLGITITKTDLLEGLVDDWLENSGVPENIIHDADITKFDEKRQDLLYRFNQWWYLYGHYKTNTGKIKDALENIDEDSPEYAEGEQLLDDYDELREDYRKIELKGPVEGETLGKKDKTKKKRVRTVGRYY